MVVVVGFYFVKFVWFWLMVENLVCVLCDEVLVEWVGFGYYLCVCNLYKCVGEVMIVYDG